MLTGFPRVFSSGMLLLLATTTTTLVHRAYASTTDDGADACEAELSTCSLEPTCSSCNLIAFSNNSRYNECFNADASAGDDDDYICLDCAGFMVGACCVDEVSDLECLENDIFVEYKLCTMESLGCSVDEVTCRETSDNEDDDSPGSASNEARATASLGGKQSAVFSIFSAFMFLLPLLWA